MADTGVGGHWEWGVLIPTFRDGPLDMVISSADLTVNRNRKDGGEADARDDYKGFLINNERFPDKAFPVKLVKRWVPNWEVVEEL